MMRVEEGRDRPVEVTRATRLTRFQSTSATTCCKFRCVMETALRPKDSQDGPQATDIFLPFLHVPYSLHPLFSLQKVNLEQKRIKLRLCLNSEKQALVTLGDLQCTETGICRRR